MFLFCIFIFLVCLYGYTFYYLHKQYKKYKNKIECYPVKHSLDNEGRLQYSVNGHLWTYILGYSDKVNYGGYIGPGLTYITFKPDEIDEYKSWCNMLHSMQLCHKWNIAALDKYRQAIENLNNKNKN